MSLTAAGSPAILRAYRRDGAAYAAGGGRGLSRVSDHGHEPASRSMIQSWSGWFLKRHWRFGPAMTFR